MSFGVSNVLGVFMEYMNRISYPYLDEFMVVFIDDIMIYLKSDKYRAKHLRIVLQTLKDKKLYEKLSKCELWLKKLIFLGHVISSGSIDIDPLKVDVMLQCGIMKSIH